MYSDKLKIYLIFVFHLMWYVMYCQEGYGNNWILGYSTTEKISGSFLDFNVNPVKISPLKKTMEMEGSIAVMSDSTGELLFYSNGCFIADRNHEMMVNGDSIGLGYLTNSFCETGGNPLNQGIISLPMPNNDSLYYLFYTDLEAPYSNSPELYFPLAPLNLYSCLIDMGLNGGKGEVISKNQLVISDTLARGMIQATKSTDGVNWWLIMPKSHSNCYYTIRLTNVGVDSIYLQCTGRIWDDHDANGQAVFSPNGLKYIRFNYYNGLNVFDFNATTGKLSDTYFISFGNDTFPFSGVAFSPNSKFVYAAAYNNLYQFDINHSNIEDSKILIAELDTQSNIELKTRFNQALLASDGKIYIAGTNTHKYLHIINKPNCPGISCAFQQYAIEMPSYNLYGLPNLPNYINWKSEIQCDSIMDSYETGVKSQVVVGPVPFNNEIVIECSECIGFNLVDIFGRIILSGIGDMEYRNLDVSTLGVGIYFILLKTKDQDLFVRRIVKFE